MWVFFSDWGGAGARAGSVLLMFVARALVVNFFLRWLYNIQSTPCAWICPHHILGEKVPKCHTFLSAEHRYVKFMHGI